MSQSFAVQLCRVVSPEKLSDRFLVSGIMRQHEGSYLGDQVLLAYIFEVNKPWFPSSKVLPSLVEVLEQQKNTLTPDSNLGDQFELLLRAVNEQLNGISESGETDWIGNLNGMIMVLGAEELHFSQTGRCPAYLLQNNRIRQITDDSAQEREPHPLKTFSNLASGSLQEQDHILFANQELYQEISLDALRRIINTASPYQSCLAIAKELKKEKNPAVSSIIITITTKGALEVVQSPEAEEVILEDAMQSGAKKLQKRLLPLLQALGHFGKKAGNASISAAKQTGNMIKTTVAPKAVELIQKGVAQVSRKDPLPEEPSTPELAQTPIVELILGRKAREQEEQKKIAQAAEERAAATYPSIIPAEELALNSTVGIGLLSTEPPQKAKDSLGARFKLWLRTGKNKKIAALILAIAFTVGAAYSAISKHTPPTTTASNQNATTLKTVTSLESKITIAIADKQTVEASSEVAQAEQSLNDLQGLTNAQSEQANSLWTTISAQGDTLSTTTRLSTVATTYSFPSTAKGFITSLPYFYGFMTNQPALLRTGQGDATVKKTINLSDQTDSIISLASTLETNTAGYALTQSNKVYRIVQNSTATSLQLLTPLSGTFATGNVLATYNGNLYILDGKSGLLWKYASTGISYNQGVSVIDSTKYDITSTVSMAIDGSIYLLKNDGTLLKFTTGVRDTGFTLTNQPVLAQKIVQPLQVYTDQNTQSIYILDGGITSGTHSTSRILEFSKTGSYLGEYAFPDSFTNVQSFSINEQSKKLWVLNNGVINEFNL